MKKFLLIPFAVLFFNLFAFSQDQYQVFSERPRETTYKGIISREVLEKDTSFKWYNPNLKGYNPNTMAVEELKKQKDSVQLIVFMGTWCEDSHEIIPKFFSFLETAGFPQTNLTILGVDRAKKTLGHLTEALNVKNVPTIIVLKNGKELGRVVEYGKYGLIDREIGEILIGSR